MTWDEWLAIGAAMLCGWGGRAFGSRDAVGGDLPMQKATAPTAAAIGAAFMISVTSKYQGLHLTDSEIMERTAEAWFLAMGAWSLVKNLGQLGSAWLKRRSRTKAADALAPPKQ